MDEVSGHSFDAWALKWRGRVWWFGRWRPRHDGFRGADPEDALRRAPRGGWFLR
jgi:hypothetical protein